MRFGNSLRIKLAPEPEQPQKPKYEFDQSYTFRLRRHKAGSFSGLWELAMLDQSGQVLKIISDADALNFCMDNVMGELEGDGF